MVNWLGVLLVLAGASVTTAVQDDKSASVLAAARQALGGDAALSAVKTWTLTGTMERHVGPRPSPSAVEINSALPDKFVQVFRQQFFTFTTTRSVGFNGDQPIVSSVMTGAGAPPLPQMPQPATPEGLAAMRASQVNRARRDYAKLALPLLASTSAIYPVTLTSAGTAALSSGTADVLEGKGPDGWTFKLYVDAATHLPVRITWMDKPVVTFTSTATVTMPIGGRGQPIGPPTNVQPAGLTWPRRMITFYGGKVFEDVRIESVRITPDIDAKTFAP